MSELVIAFPDGERRYPVPQFEQLTYKELSTIERITSTPAARWEEASESIMFPLALGYIATQRAGESISIDELEQLPGTAISISGDDEVVPTEAAEDGGEMTFAEPGTQDS